MADDKINQLEISMAKMETKIDNICESVDSIKDTLEKYIEKAETKYAGKWVEKISVGVIVAIAGVIIKMIVEK